MTDRQVGRQSVLRHIKLGRNNANNIINPNVVYGTSGHDATRHITESKANIKCCIINARSIISKTNMLQSMLLKDIDICAITETWINSEEETAIQSRLLSSGYVIKFTPRPKCLGGGIVLIVKTNIEI